MRIIISLIIIYWFQVILVAYVVHFLYYIHRISSILDGYDKIHTDLSDLIIPNNNLILTCNLFYAGLFLRIFINYAFFF